MHLLQLINEDTYLVKIMFVCMCVLFIYFGRGGGGVGKNLITIMGKLSICQFQLLICLYFEADYEMAAIFILLYTD